MSEATKKSKVVIGEFIILCIGAFLLSISYGVTFLIPMIVEQRGGDEALAGLIISAATASTVILVILSGHIADKIGTVRAVAFSSIFLATSSLGFALIPSAGANLMIIGAILGIGWGMFYTLGPILVAAIIEPERRVKFFALLSGSMMMGIGAGPIIGRIATSFSFPIEAAFIVAFTSSLISGILYFLLHQRFIKSGKVTPQIAKISFQSAREVINSKAIYSIMMVGIGGAVFGGLSSFQTSYAKYYDFDYSLFFAGFMSAAIVCRLLLAGYVTKKDPLISLLVLTGIMSFSIILFITVTTSSLIYFLAAAMLGIGYGLTYSIINGLVANEAPSNRMPQSLLLFSLSYFIGVFGFPLIAGNLIVSSGIQFMLYAVFSLTIINFSIVLLRILLRFIRRDTSDQSEPA
jgi:MFS family permease